MNLKTSYGYNGCSVLKLTYCIVTDDLSDQKPATQSTTYPGSHDNYKAGNAVDRNTATCMRTEIIGPNSPYKTVWWKVDLGEVYSIYSVNILFKNYDGYGMNLLMINAANIHFKYMLIVFAPKPYLAKTPIIEVESIIYNKWFRPTWDLFTLPLPPNSNKFCPMQVLW